MFVLPFAMHLKLDLDCFLLLTSKNALCIFEIDRDTVDSHIEKQQAEIGEENVDGVLKARCTAPISLYDTDEIPLLLVKKNISFINDGFFHSRAAECWDHCHWG